MLRFEPPPAALETTQRQAEASDALRRQLFRDYRASQQEVLRLADLARGVSQLQSLWAPDYLEGIQEALAELRDELAQRMEVGDGYLWQLTPELLAKVHDDHQTWGALLRRLCRLRRCCRPLSSRDEATLNVPAPGRELVSGLRSLERSIEQLMETERQLALTLTASPE